MHDPARDGSLHSYNFCGDEFGGQFDPMYALGSASDNAAPANIFANQLFSLEFNNGVLVDPVLSGKRPRNLGYYNFAARPTQGISW